MCVCTYVCADVLMPHAVPNMSRLTRLADSLMTFRLMLSVILCDVFSVTPQLSTRAHLLPSPPTKFRDSALSNNLFPKPISSFPHREGSPYHPAPPCQTHYALENPTVPLRGGAIAHGPECIGAPASKRAGPTTEKNFPTP